MPPARPPAEPSTAEPMQAARPGGLLLDIGGVLHASASYLVHRMAEREPAVRPLLDEIGGLATERDELWQAMLRRELSEREYWAQRATELGATLGESWDTRDLIGRLYELPRHDWLRADMVDLMADTRAAGLRLGALTNDMAAFHGQDWVDQQDYLARFDVVIDAGLTGVLKPDPRAFTSAAQALGLPLPQVVFLDDMPWNVEGARAVGMTAIRVPWDDPGPAIDAARELLRLAPRRHRDPAASQHTST
jgi:putative hydrolase of the HAD superfamily